MEIKCRKKLELFYTRVNFKLKNNGLVADASTKKEALSELLEIMDVFIEDIQQTRIEVQKMYQEECISNDPSFEDIIQMVKCKRLPSSFDKWSLSNHGIAVAHMAARYGNLPKNFHIDYPEIWESKNNRGDSVRDVALKHNYEINNKYYYTDEIWTWVGGDINLDKTCMSDDVIQAAAKICNAKSPIFRSRLRLTVLDYEDALQQSRTLFSQTTVSRILLEVVHK